jgi:uncharacterized protein YbaA (DUF1428 family)
MQAANLIKAPGFDALSDDCVIHFNAPCWMSPIKTFGLAKKILDAVRILLADRNVFQPTHHERGMSEEARRLVAASATQQRREAMTYVVGFVTAVPTANKEAYREHAQKAAVLLKEFGATRVIDAWGDDVPDGEVTDFKGAVKAKTGEEIVFSWHEYADQAAADAAFETMMSDPRMHELGSQMPFDGKRMIIGGFETVIDHGAKGRPAYVDGTLIPVPADKKEIYAEVDSTFAQVIKEHGATRVVGAWGDDVTEAEVTGYRQAVKASDGEKIIYGWVEWPSKQVRDAGWEKVMADPRMYRDDIPYDNARRVHGGFATILDA